ncbi:NAD(P)-dependent alcohol dehydrogenase [Streptomyces lonarensis]|uniref:NAD(P)-dependent alcohol dehydrogenase n=1 Tax=Streptomyces lonarensis TaxID=700599 RepID=A0A7X6D2Q0_9ACTN|nr:NAD(P)-dependent alcohol dehydrogenase [Streptomyces lonarensis]NJQ07097.1 NAD(P)-dependent alcohol dehydrogenase [Streptomyces lonarensis]
MTDMDAVLFDRYGPPDVLRVGRVARPTAGEGELLVRVHALGVNGGELAARSGRIRLITGRRFPQRLGIDLVGEVASVGPGVVGREPGEQVWGVLGRTMASAAEYVAVAADRTAPAPAALSATESASLIAGATTSLTALSEKAGLRPGERLLVRGAAGGVGSVAVQVGKHLGARVTALASEGAREFLTGLGADEVVDRRRHGPADLGEFDVVLDTVGTEHRAYRRLLAPGGRMVAIALDYGRLPAAAGYLLVSAVHGRRRVRFFSGAPDTALLVRAAQLAEQGVLRPVVDTVHPLAAVADAHRALESGGVRGKHVLRVV